MPQVLGRFGRLRQSLINEKNKKDCQPSILVKSSQRETSVYSSEKLSLVYEWLMICLTEGHIEPSQPKVGRICGWPQRPFFCESLYIDFECWCIKRDILPREIAGGNLFYSVTDRMFQREGDKYHFPLLEECRKKYKSLAEDIYARTDH